jgi:putative transcriptional regulator
MAKAFEKILTGLVDAHAYLKGARDGFEVHEAEVPEPDVTAIRGKTGFSQPASAKSIGVPLGTLKN